MVILINAAIINLVVSGLFLVVNLHLYQIGVAPAAIGAIDAIAGIAAIAGSTATGWAMRHFRPGVLAIVVFWGWALACIPIPLTDNVVAIGGLIAIGMGINPVGNAALMAYRIAITPDRLQGRSMSAIMFVSQASAPVSPPSSSPSARRSARCRWHPEWGSVEPVESADDEDGDMTATDAR